MQNHELSLIGERHLKCNVSLMSWSSKRDLLCLAIDSGDVQLYRLSSFEKVWSLPPTEKDSRIHSICWRPDGCVIGVSYDSKEVGIHFVYMEKANVIYRLSDETVLLKRPGVTLRWYELENEKLADDPVPHFASLTFKDYLSDLPKLHSKDLSVVDIKSIIGSSKFHVLLVADEQNCITAYAYGVFPLLSIPCNFYQLSGHQINVLDMCLSDDFKFMVNVLSCSDKHGHCDTQFVKLTHALNDVNKCKLLAEKVCHLNAIIKYLENVLDLMKESCETVVQEMEAKLTNYLINKSLSGTIGDEFMHFLLWGKPSEVIEELLMNSMTPKGVVKLGTLVEASYISIQQLLLVHFQLASDALYYHLVEIKGMCTATLLNDFQLLDVVKIDEILTLTGSFILKATEMQQVINQSLKNFKAFFRWLYSCLLKLHDTPLEETPQMSMKEMEFVSDFIMESFIHEHEQLKMSGKDKHFNLDKVYQYLQDSPLASQHNLDSNDWFHLVDSTPSLSGNPFILKRRPSASLRQLFSELKNHLKDLFYCSNVVVVAEDIAQSVYLPLSSAKCRPKVVQWFQTGKSQSAEFLSLTAKDNFPCEEIVLNKLAVETSDSTTLRMQFSNQKGGFHSIQDFSYFNHEFFAVILNQNSTSSIAMVSVKSILEDLAVNGVKNNSSSGSYVCDVSQFVTLRCSTESLTANKLATSGSRSILSVIGDDNRFIKAYELDLLNEDDMEDTELDSSTLST